MTTLWKHSKIQALYESDPQFYADTMDLFLKRKAGHLYNWLYSSPHSANDRVRGNELLDRLYLNCPDYYLYQQESRLIAESASVLAQLIGPHATLIDYGPGPVRSYTRKTLPILEQLIAPRRYVPVDICPEYVAGCEQETHNRLPGMVASGIVGDFYDRTISHKAHTKPVVYFSGSSIANCPEQSFYTLPNNTLNRIQIIHDQLHEHGYLVIGHDTNQDEHSLRAAYDNPYLSDLIRNVLHRMVRDLPVKNFNPNLFTLWVEWDIADRCIKMGVRATHDQRFILGHLNISIASGEIFHIASSYKYSSELFIKTAQGAGFVHERTLSLTDNPMVMHIFSVQKAS